MDKRTEDLLIKGGAIIGAYFIVVKPILKKFGISEEDASLVATVSNIDPADSPYSKDYSYGYIQYQGWKFPTDFNNEFAAFRANNNPIETGYDQIAETLYNEFQPSWANVFKFSADYGIIKTILTQVDSKSGLSYIDGYLQANYNIGLLPLLKNGGATLLGIGTLNNGLNDTQLADLFKMLDKLPITLNPDKNSVTPPSASQNVTWHSFLGF